MDINNNYQPIHTPSQDAQQHSYELQSQTQILSANEPNVNNNQETKKKTKKKCRGDRKAQHCRRRMRRREQKMNDNNQTHTDQHMDQNILMYEENHNLNEERGIIQNGSLNTQHDSRIINKRKRDSSNRDNQHISQSFSQLSLSQGNMKKKKSSMTRNNQSDNDELLNEINDVDDDPMDNNPTKKKMKNKDENNDDSLSMNDMQNYKPHYLRVSDHRFKQMLSNAIQDGDKIVQSLDTDEKIQFVRQMTEAANNVYYFDLQRQLWQAYYNVKVKEDSMSTTTAGQRQLSKFDAKQLNTCHKSNFPKHIIIKCQQRIGNQVQRAVNELNEYLIKLNTCTSQWQPPIDPNIVSKAIDECVKRGQERLRQEFDYKKKMFELNSNDHYLINKVYELQPTDEQLRLAKMIWQTTTDELKTKEKQEILRKRIFLQRLPATFNKIIDQSIEHVQPMLSNPVLDKDRRAGLISNYSKTITQYKFDSLQNIRRGYEQTLVDLQRTLSESDCSQVLKEAIEHRQEAMRKRHEVYLNHQLNSFFGEAPPMTVSNQ